MARSFESDPLMSCNFALIEVPTAGLIPLAFPYKTLRSALSNGNFVGFQTMTVPEISLETKEIRQGNNQYVHRVPTGFSSGGNVVLSQAVLRLAGDMGLWFKQALNGVFSPRRNMLLVHTRLDRALPARIIQCSDCIPVSWKPASDFDANSSTVSMESLTFFTPRVDIIFIPPTDMEVSSF